MYIYIYMYISLCVCARVLFVDIRNRIRYRGPLDTRIYAKEKNTHTSERHRGIAILPSVCFLSSLFFISFFSLLIPCAVCCELALCLSLSLSRSSSLCVVTLSLYQVSPSPYLALTL